jgi:hemoglobin
LQEHEAAMNDTTRSRSTVVIDGVPLPDLLDEDLVHAVVHGFYDKIRADELLGPIFYSVIPPEAWPHHLAKMCSFWSSLLLRTGSYDGRPMPAHLAKPRIGDEHIRRWLTLFRGTVNDLCPPQIASLFMDRALRIAHSFRLAIAFSRGESGMDVEPIYEDSL